MRVGGGRGWWERGVEEVFRVGKRRD